MYAHRLSLELFDTNLRGPYILSCEIARRNPRHMAGLPKGGTFAGFRCRKAITRHCRSTGASAGADVTGKKEQEQGRVLDKPISTPEPAAGSPREGTPRPAGQPREGAMGERRVSEPPPEARPLPVRPRERAGATAGAAGPHRGFHSRNPAAGPPVSPNAATRIHPGLPGAAAPPTGSANQPAGFLTTFRSLRTVRTRCAERASPYLVGEIDRAIHRASQFAASRFDSISGDFRKTVYARGLRTKVERAYESFQIKAGRAENEGDTVEATEIRGILKEIDRHAEKQLLGLCDNHGLAWPASIQGPRRTPSANIPPWDWCTAHRNLLGIRDHLQQAGASRAALRFEESALRMTHSATHFFKTHGGKVKELLPVRRGHGAPQQISRPEQMYRILEAKASQAKAASGGRMLPGICGSIKSMNETVRRVLRDLAGDYGPLEDLAARTGLNERQAPATAGPGATHATAPATVTPPPQPLAVRGKSPPAGAPAPRSMAQLLSAPPGPSSRVMPAPAANTATAPGPDVPSAQRQAVAERLRSDAEAFDAQLTLISVGADALCWSAAREGSVLADIKRLNTIARVDPAAAADLPGIDWSGIEALLGILDAPPQSPSPSPDT